MYNTRVTFEISRAQLAILDGSWQERPDTLATFEAGATRGTLYISVEVIGDAPERDALAREMIETAQKNYAGSRGSITLASPRTILVARGASRRRSPARDREKR